MPWKRSSRNSVSGFFERFFGIGDSNFSVQENAETEGSTSTSNIKEYTIPQEKIYSFNADLSKAANPTAALRHEGSNYEPDIRIVQGSVTDLHAEAVVNAANTGLKAGTGVCGAIFSAAGKEKLEEACKKIGFCETGKAVVTEAFDRDAKIIIHTVGPVYTDGNSRERSQLYGCYINSMTQAEKHQCNSIAFPLIASGRFGYPKDEAWEIAIRAVRDYLEKKTDWRPIIYFAVLSEDSLKAGKKALAES